MRWLKEMGAALWRRLRSRLVRLPAVPDAVPVHGEEVCGDVRLHSAFPSRILDGPRHVVVYLPPDYASSRQRYPVVYAHDGQNLFDPRTAFAGKWDLDGTAERLIRQGQLRGVIIVGIYNAEAQRLHEYTPVVDEGHGTGGGADRYGRFLVQELKPFIDRRYRTLDGPEHTATMGSSLGGLVSLYLAFCYPHVFGLCGAVSPSLWWGEDYLTRWLEDDPRRRGPRRIWLDMGSEEGEKDAQGVAHAIHRTRELRELLQSRGYHEGETLFYREVEGAHHNEPAWAARAADILMALLGEPWEQKAAA